MAFVGQRIVLKNMLALRGREEIPGLFSSGVFDARPCIAKGLCYSFSVQLQGAYIQIHE
jgi:hypothetical protein